MGKLYLGDSMLSERLLDIRDEAELNQEDMAEILKVSQQIILGGKMEKN